MKLTIQVSGSGTITPRTIACALVAFDTVIRAARVNDSLQKLSIETDEAFDADDADTVWELLCCSTDYELLRHSRTNNHTTTLH